ncbi:MAG TPA: hypothetical protein VMS56_14550 [Thermoanaerobaculia bacterium]|nr:hypothetical protein [Thermoanaerobaculia bacterium]
MTGSRARQIPNMAALAAVRSPLLVETGCALLRTQPFSRMRGTSCSAAFPEPDRAPLRASAELSR